MATRLHAHVPLSFAYPPRRGADAVPVVHVFVERARVPRQVGYGFAVPARAPRPPRFGHLAQGSAAAPVEQVG